MRKRGKTDANQAAIVHDLRKWGYSVWITSGCGNGAPDLVVGRGKANFMFEVKDPAKPPSARKLTDDEKQFHAGWNGQIDVIETVKDAIEVMARS